MGCLIDSCVLIGFERGKWDLKDIISNCKDDAFYLSVITASELLHGVYRATNASIMNQRSAFVEEVLRQFPILEIDITTARLHAKIWADLLSQGNTIGGHDLWIAASCLAHNHKLITDNVDDFSRVSGLQLIAVR